MKKVLVISENFKKGGLEKQITDIDKCMSSKLEFIYLFENYEQNSYLESKKIYKAKLNEEMSFKEFNETINTISNIIEKENIDLIHAHPFSSIFPAYIAAHKNKKPLIYTIHGLSSVTSFGQLPHRILFEYLINDQNVKKIVVAKEYEEKLNKNNNIADIYFIPNTVDTKKFKEVKNLNDNKIALISRLDIDKIEEIKKFLIFFKDIKNKTLDIIGSGTNEEELKEIVEKLDLKERVKFLGYIENIPELTSKNKYSTIVGIGQVSLESMSMNIPNLLIGYGHITGFIDKDRFFRIKDNNFVNRKEVGDSLEKIKKDLESRDKDRFKMRNEVVKYSDTSILKEKYINIINEMKYTLDVFVLDLIKKIENNNTDEKIYYSGTLLDYLSDTIRRNIFNSNIQNYFVSYYFYQSQLNILKNYAENEKAQKNKSLKQKIVDKLWTFKPYRSLIGFKQKILGKDTFKNKENNKNKKENENGNKK